jgi:hypothetical protein
VVSEQLVHALSAWYLSEVEDCGLGFAILLGGCVSPLNVVQEMKSPVPSVT